MTMPAEDSYWQIGNDTTQFWSTAQRTYVAPDNAGLLVWLATGRTLIRVGFEGDIQTTLSDLGLGILGPLPDSAAVDMERDRRVALGTVVTLSDAQTFTVQTRNADDFRNISGLATSALALKAAGQNPVIQFRDADNINRDLTTDLTIELGLQVAAFVQTIYAKSWAVKAMTPIPLDFISDSYWT